MMLMHVRVLLYGQDCGGVERFRQGLIENPTATCSNVHPRMEILSQAC
jgi:hypothetical protein